MSNSNEIRCFVSLDLPPGIIQLARNVQANIQKQKLVTAKYTDPRNLHLTLKFLGEISPQKVEQVKRMLSEVNFNPTNIQISDLGVFSRKYIRILWLKVEGANHLQKQIDNSLKELFPIEDRFMGHVTIARIKTVFNKNELLQYLDEYIIEPENLLISEFKLKQSILSSTGPTYKTIQTFKKN